jgi:uncharacterized protein YqeY
MSLVDRLNDDLKAAMKSGDTVRRDTIRLALAAIHRAEKDLQQQQFETLDVDAPEDVSVADVRLDEAGVEQTLRREIRQRQDSIEAYDKAGRRDLAERERAELEILQAYLPQLMDRDEIGEVVSRIIIEVGATGPQDLKMVMPRAMAELRGKADGREVNAVVSQLLGAKSR